MTDCTMQTIEITYQAANDEALDIKLLYDVTDEALEAAGSTMVLSGGPAPPSIQVCY